MTMDKIDNADDNTTTNGLAGVKSLTDQEIITIRKASYGKAGLEPWSDTLAFADALLTAIGHPRKK